MKSANRKAMFANKNTGLASSALFKIFADKEGRLIYDKIPTDARVRIIDEQKHYNSPEPKFVVEAISPPTRNHGSMHKQLGIFRTLKEAQHFTNTNHSGDGEYY